MYKSLFILLGTTISALTLSVSGCSSEVQSGISGSGAPVLVAGGPISGFGSVILNGNRFNTEDTQFFVNGAQAEESDLQLGQQITLISEGSTDDAALTADQIRFNTDVQGTVISKDATTNSLNVLAQTINISLNTVYAASGENPLDTILEGQNVSVSGVRNSQGVISATRIDLTNSDQGILTGEINSLNSTTGLFQIGELSIDASQLTNLADLTEGQLVQVTTSASSQGSLVAAERVRMLDPKVKASNGQKLSMQTEIESVSSLAGKPVFYVPGYTARVDSNTLFVGGSEALLQKGQTVKLEGIISNGEILLNSIDFILPPTRVTEYRVASIELESDGTVHTGHIVMTDGTVINCNEITRYHDGSDEQNRYLDLARIHSGDQLRISHYPAGNEFIATMIFRSVSGSFQENL